MATCFVIQPFDGAVYDKRYEDVFKQSIINAKLEPYRVDRDPSVSVPINEIESGIRRAEICFAEISTNNPNVWFELGFAIAAKKEVVLVCDDKRREIFPFDVQHRSIINYKTESSSDYKELEEKITKRLVAALEKQLELGTIASTSTIVTTEGLSQQEVVGLVSTAALLDSSDSFKSAWAIRQDMQKAGFTDIAITLALRKLQKIIFIKAGTAKEENGQDYNVYSLTDEGYAWLEKNQDKLIIKTEPEIPF